MPENRFGWCECTTCENEVVSLAKYDPVFSNDENTKKKISTSLRKYLLLLLGNGGLFVCRNHKCCCTIRLLSLLNSSRFKRLNRVLSLTLCTIWNHNCMRKFTNMALGSALGQTYMHNYYGYCWLLIVDCVCACDKMRQSVSTVGHKIATFAQACHIQAIR